MSTPSLQKLEQCKQNLEQLKARRTKLQVQLESARQQYQAAAEEARQEHGTDSLPRLKAKLAAMESDNEKAATEFIRAVTEFEGYISKIEQALANPEALSALLASLPAQAPQAPDPSPSSLPAAFSEEDI